MTCWATTADRNHQADEAGDALYEEELERRTLALMEPGPLPTFLAPGFNPEAPSNILEACEFFDDASASKERIFDYWYKKAEAKAAAEMAAEPTKYHEDL